MINQFKKMPCKAAVVDDCGYLMTHYFMQHHREKSSNQSFEMYDSIADIMYSLVDLIKREVPEDKIIYLILHEDVDDFGNTKLRTIGRLLDNKVCLEGMVTICIRCISDNGKHYFLTRTDGRDVVKTPEDLFGDEIIDNNLKLVDTAIREYYDMEPINTENNEQKQEEPKK